MATPEDDLVEQLVRKLDHRFSLRKNGDTWPSYLGKIATPERLMLVVLMVWQFGGEFRDLQRQVEALATTKAEVDAIAVAMQTQIEEHRVITAEYKGTVEALMMENAALAATAKSLNDRVGLAITRGDFNRVVQLQIIPRLEKIEKAQASAAAFSGEQQK
jgi:hypothetical protein